MPFAYTRTNLVLVLLLIPGIAGAQVKDNNQNGEPFTMTITEKNKEIVQNLYEQSLNTRNFEYLRKIISDDFKGPGGKRGAEAFEDRVTPLIKAFSDVQWNIQEVFGEGDKVIIRWKLEGTHTKPFMNIEATGKPVSNEGIGIYELNYGKIINAWVQTDRLGFLEELGVLPSDFIASLGESVQKDRVIFIDKFWVPEKAKEEFITGMNYNRNFIKGLSGFVYDKVYEHIADVGSYVIITIAVWENEEALNRAKSSVQAEYKRVGFHPEEFMERLNIKMERATYRER